MTREERERARIAEARAMPVEYLYPLAQYLMPHKQRMDRDGVPNDRRAVSLCKEDWEKQYNAQIHLCLGITIRWI